MYDNIIKFRQDLHQIPELAFDLYKTHDYVVHTLKDMGYSPIIMAKTGVVVVKEGISKKALLFRTDMDALPVLEKTERSFQSKHVGKMHACGHDGHMAIMLSFAHYVSTLENLKKTIVMIFQPAEEGPGGAKVMIEEGLFKMFDIEASFGIHLYPHLEQGLYGLTKGPMLAQNGEFDFTILGKSAHGAKPDQGHDAILATSFLINAYQSIISRKLDPIESGVITVGTIKGGEARNIIASEVHISGTMRAFTEPIYHHLKHEITKINHSISSMFDVNIKGDIIDYYPPVINDHQLFEQLVDSLDPSAYQLLKPMTFSEDFAFYQKMVPGLFVMLGTKNEKKGFIHPLHSCYFDFDESVLIKGVELYQLLLTIHNVI